MYTQYNEQRLQIIVFNEVNQLFSDNISVYAYDIGYNEGISMSDVTSL